MQAMRTAEPEQQIRILHEQAASSATEAPGKPRWQYYLQSRDVLHPLELVCGTESEVDGMKTSAASRLRSATQSLVLMIAVIGTAGLLA